jgi:hypothetical protein
MIIPPYDELQQRPGETTDPIFEHPVAPTMSVDEQSLHKYNGHNSLLAVSTTATT